MIPVPVCVLPHGEGLDLPSYATEGAAGMDLVAAIMKPIVIKPFHVEMIPTGLSVAVPPGHEMQIRPRSGLAYKHSLIVPNSPGTVDEDYRGEVCVLLLNLGESSFKIERGMRIAQAILSPVTRFAWKKTGSLCETERGIGGFGSTGVH